MISIKKLASLNHSQKIRKIVMLLQNFETQLAQRKNTPKTDSFRKEWSFIKGYMLEIISLLLHEKSLQNQIQVQTRKVQKQLKLTTAPPPRKSELRYEINTLRHYLLRDLGVEPADWNLLDVTEYPVDRKRRKVLPCTVYLDDIRSPYNVGSIFRTAEAFGVEKIYLSPDTPSPHKTRAQRTAMGATSYLPWEILAQNEIPKLSPVFALETGGTPLWDYEFPEQALLILGSEEVGISPPLRSLAQKDMGIVSIPLIGKKVSLNVGVAFGILMNAWVQFLVSKNTFIHPE